MATDPILEIDEDKMRGMIDGASQYIEDLQRQRDATKEVEQQVQTEQTQAKAEQDDPRNKENWGFKGLVKEGQSILSGGLQDTASSIATFPERTVDALSGEMSKELKEKGYYRPDWHPFTDYENPIETKTWWGKLLRGVVHFGSMAAAIVPAAKVTAARTGIAIAGLGGKTVLSSFARGAAIGATSDLISKESDGHNALGTLRDHYGFIDTPLSTKDTDHPIWMKLKNIVEGMGIGTLFDGASILLGKGSKKVIAKVQARNKNIEDVTIQSGLRQLRKAEGEFRADKNRPIAEAHQGAHISEQTPYEAWETQKRIRTEWGAEEGSTGSVTTPVQRERIAREADISEDTVDGILRKLYSNEKYQAVIQSVKAGRQTLSEVFGDSILAYQRITEGRNAAEMTASEYLEEIFKTSDTYDITDSAGKTIDKLETITSKNIVVTDLVVGSLLHQIRDTGIAGRELADIANLGDIDGPASQIIDTMVTALTEVKKARIIKSQNFRDIGAGKQRNFVQSKLTEEMADTRESIMSILKIAKEGETDEIMNALFETFSSMKTVNNLIDFDNWAKKMIRGGQLDAKGPDRTGALIRELEGVFVHSVLSGPKTPMRAIMGTSTATFLRPLSTTLGATMRYPFTGDSATIRAGLASINAMMEAIPESFELFRTRLNSYWSGDVASIKTRYSEYTRNDNNWELLRRYYEDSGRATDGDKAAFAMANMARNMNNNRFLTYSTKLMAATDDAFAFILGRAKAREKAMRSVLDIQAAGGKTPQITRELMSAYEQDFYEQIFDADGNIIDEATKFARKEVTLTQELTGFAKGLNDVFTANPWAKPFFLFARTGVNGLSLTAKHTPGFNFLVKEFNDIAFATVDNLDNVRQYGINSTEELMNAKALQTGRLGMGAALVSMASWAWMRGDLTGNGPADRQKRQMWLDGKYQPRSIKLGDVWVGHESIEPFSQIMTIIADIGDVSQLMGSEWTEKELQKVSLVLAQGIASKSYLAGMQQFVDLLGGRPGQAERILAGIANNTVPLAGLRNELGKLFTPYTRELGSGIDQALRNRNLITENLTGEPLPIKYDLLNGSKIKDHDFMTRMFNMFSPIPLNLDQSPGRKLLFDSGYDIRLSTYYSPNGDNLSDSPEVRSLFQEAIGKQNLELKLNKLAEDERIQGSVQEMNRVIRSGQRGDFDTMDFNHNIRIDNIFQKARRKAWASIMNDPRVLELIKQTKDKKRRKYTKRIETRNVQPILNMPVK